MQKLSLPHHPPLLFAQEILEKEQKRARVKLRFPTFPSLAMLIEGAAQSSAALSNSESQMGFLVSLKDIKLLNAPTTQELEVELTNLYNLGVMSSISFEIFAAKTSIASGSLVIAKEG